MIAHVTGPDGIAFEVLLVGAGWLAWAGWARLKGRNFLKWPKSAGWVMVGVAGVFLIAAIFVPPLLRQKPSATRPSTPVRVEIVAPTAGQSATGETMEVQVKLTGPGAGEMFVSNRGHIHISIDGRLVSMLNGTEQPVPVANLSPGSHTLQVELVAPDHGPFGPRVIATQDFTVPGTDHPAAGSSPPD